MPASVASNVILKLQVTDGIPSKGYGKPVFTMPSILQGPEVRINLPHFYLKICTEKNIDLLTACNMDFMMDFYLQRFDGFCLNLLLLPRKALKPRFIQHRASSSVSITIPKVQLLKLCQLHSKTTLLYQLAIHQKKFDLLKNRIHQGLMLFTLRRHKSFPPALSKIQSSKSALHFSY